ncbi:MAG: aldo/keto reductase, partial [Pseudonocardiaceae bacterium]
MSPLELLVLPGLNAEVSAIGAGCWTIGGPATNRGVPVGWDEVNEDAAYAGLVRAHELGITLYDTADVYGLGRSERLLGQLLSEVPRDELVISSKVGYFVGTSRHPYKPAQIRHQLATTLDNLNTDYLDIYFLHSSDFGADDQYLTSTVALLHEFRQQGLIRAFGMRAPHIFAEQWAKEDGPHSAATKRWLDLFYTVRPAVLTARYNLLSPLYGKGETDIFAFARRQRVGVLIKQALGQGQLIRRYDPDRLPTFSTSDHRCADPAFSPENRQGLD